MKELEVQLDAAERDAHNLVAGLTADEALRRPDAGSWSVSECLDHLATCNRAYLEAMDGPARRARDQGRLRCGPATPGLVGRLFLWTIEPPVKVRVKAPEIIRPRNAPAVADAMAGFMASQDAVRAFVRTYEDIDLAGVRFPNPFIPGVRFSLATGLYVIPAHERRHLWQAWRVRQAVVRTRRSATAR